MAKSFITELEITDMEFPNKGIGYLNGQKVFVKHAFPGQVIQVSVKPKKNNLEGKLISLIKNAPGETEPACPESGLCGGCAYQRISYGDEILLKERLVLDLLEKSQIKDFEYLGIIPSPVSCGYKNKMEFSFGDFTKDGELELGMRKRNSYYEVVTPVNCNIIDDDYKKILLCVLRYFRAKNESFYHKSTHVGSLRHLVIRKAAFTGEILVNIVTSSSLASELALLCSDLTDLELSGAIRGILHTVNDCVADTVKPERVSCLYGSDFIYENLLGLKFKITPFSFFQTNSYGAEKLYETVREFVLTSGGETVFDLYSGTGTITQIISGHAGNVTGVEIVPEAVDSARSNADLNGIKNCSFMCGDVLDKLAELTGNPGLIILDPPREGVHPKALSKIAQFNASKIIYISCNPVTLVRDLAGFKQAGYLVDRIKLCDLFPRTYHVETVVLLSNAENNG